MYFGLISLHIASLLFRQTPLVFMRICNSVAMYHNSLIECNYAKLICPDAEFRKLAMVHSKSLVHVLFSR